VATLKFEFFVLNREDEKIGPTESIVGNQRKLLSELF
jgi:hypothetical protein